MTDSQLEWTGERYLPEIGGTIALEHLHRYLLARELAKGKDVLDIACGEGYGSAMLAEVAIQVSGVDISDEAVVHATEKYLKDNLQFLVGSCAEIPLPDDSVDLVVSFETIEHHEQHQEMMQEIKRVLRPDGVLLISSPDKHEFTDIGEQGTHYHVKELYRDEFVSLINGYFAHSTFLGQRVLFGSAILSETLHLKSSTYMFDDKNFESAEGMLRPLYLLAVASDTAVPDFTAGILEQTIHQSDAVRHIHDECVQLHQTVGRRDATVEELHHKVEELHHKVEELHHKVADKDKAIEELHHKVVTLIEQVEHLQNNATVADETILLMEKERGFNVEALSNLETQLYAVLSSRSWRITAPLRNINRLKNWKK